jgi:SDR family mycofactocin-dependent oxidoreductase
MLEGKVAFITGAARGQGRSHAVRLAREGADIVAFDICADVPPTPYPMTTEADLQETADLVKNAGARVLPYKGDVRTIAELRSAVAAGVAELGRLDVVVANAGIAPMVISADDQELAAAWEAVIGVNLTGVWNTVRACVPPMIEQGEGGSIVLISSTAGLKGLGMPGALGGEGYGAAKHGVVGLMRTFAVELAMHSIRVNSIHSTGVDTPMVNNDMMRHFLELAPAAAQSLTNLLPVELLQPEDVSDAVLFLTSDLSRFITGVALPVDAGFTTK